ncbi:hypothetical protein EGW08_018048, partial [Elysia chlorotica]
DVWFQENTDGLTPLKLAAHMGAGKVCAHLLTMDGVYRHLVAQDDLFDVHQYDITELDPRACTNRQRYRLCSPGSQSVLEMVCGMSSTQAYCIIGTTVVRFLIREKWLRLLPVYCVWLLGHLLFMAGLTLYAVYRPRLGLEDSYTDNGSSSEPSDLSDDTLTTAQRDLVRAWPFINLLVSLLYLSLECVRTLYLQHAWHFLRPYGLYRLLLAGFSICLLADSLWFWIDQHTPDSNMFLILALLMGGWFLTFFLSAWRKFSFFTILVQKVLFGDMTRFSIMIFLELLLFSVAMHVAYLPSRSPPGLPQEFETIWSSVLTMFRLMLGLSDIE